MSVYVGEVCVTVGISESFYLLSFAFLHEASFGQ